VDDLVKGKEDRRVLESEIDSGLLSLRTLDKSKSLDPKGPDAKLYEELKRYRARHPDAETLLNTKQ
jgi:hypothetical protein